MSLAVNFCKTYCPLLQFSQTFRCSVQVAVCFLDVKHLSLGNSIPFYCALILVVTTLSRSLRRRKLLVQNSQLWYAKLILAWQSFSFAACCVRNVAR